VYCGIHESRYGGIDNYHVDHFRPKSLKQFEHLCDVITNLYLACAICNRFKSNDWPNDPVPDHSVASYSDPATCAYHDLFSECDETHRVSGNYPASIYMVERLGLNRSQLLIDRRLDALLARWNQLKEMLEALDSQLDQPADSELHRLLVGLLKTEREVTAALEQVFTTRPYSPGEQKKSK
jgi:hypothetical protein